MYPTILTFLAAALAGSVNKPPQHAIDHQREQNRVGRSTIRRILKEQRLEPAPQSVISRGSCS
jgi:hypothetical protein